MAEKRYQWYIDGVDIWDNQKEERIDDTPTLLNGLNDENEQLKKDFDSVSHNWALMYNEAKNKVEELSKENQKLKSINNQLEDRLEESGIGK